MPRYFFHVSHHALRSDVEGSELADIHAARVAAVHLCGEMIQEIDEHFWDDPSWQLRVTDDKQKLLFTLTFSAEEHADAI